MPKINTLNDDSFLIEANQTCQRITRRAASQTQANREKSKPAEYWREQRRRMNDPKAQSYNDLTDYIAV